MQFPNQPLGVKWKVVKVVHCSTLLMDTGVMSLFPAGKSYYKKKVNFGHANNFSTSRGKMEGCEICTLSHSMDGHRSYVSIFL